MKYYPRTLSTSQMLFIAVFLYIHVFSFIAFFIMLSVILSIVYLTLVAESVQIHIKVVLGVSMITSVPVLQM